MNMGHYADGSEYIEPPEPTMEELREEFPDHVFTVNGGQIEITYDHFHNSAPNTRQARAAALYMMGLHKRYAKDINLS